MPLAISPALQASYRQTEALIIRSIEFRINGAFFVGLVKNFKPLTLNDDDGNSHVFQPADLEIGFSAREAGIRQGLRFSFSMGRDQFAGYRELARFLSREENSAQVIYREYLEDDPDPQFSGIELELIKLAYKEPKVLLEASFAKIADYEFPFLRYYPETFTTLNCYGN